MHTGIIARESNEQTAQATNTYYRLTNDICLEETSSHALAPQCPWKSTLKLIVAYCLTKPHISFYFLRFEGKLKNFKKLKQIFFQLVKLIVYDSLRFNKKFLVSDVRHSLFSTICRFLRAKNPSLLGRYTYKLEKTHLNFLDWNIHPQRATYNLSWEMDIFHSSMTNYRQKINTIIIYVRVQFFEARLVV